MQGNDTKRSPVFFPRLWSHSDSKGYYKKERRRDRSLVEDSMQTEEQMDDDSVSQVAQASRSPSPCLSTKLIFMNC